MNYTKPIIISIIIQMSIQSPYSYIEHNTSTKGKHYTKQRGRRGCSKYNNGTSECSSHRANSSKNNCKNGMLILISNSRNQR